MSEMTIQDADRHSARTEEALEDRGRREEAEDRAARHEERGQQVTPTPERWKAECLLHFGWAVYDPETGNTVVRAEGADYGHRDRYAPYHCEKARDAMRLICAAVNACREAGYSVEELEAGLLRGTKVALLNAQMLLAECREALSQIASRTEASVSVHVMYLPSCAGEHFGGEARECHRIARALLTRLEA